MTTKNEKPSALARQIASLNAAFHVLDAAEGHPSTGVHPTQEAQDRAIALAARETEDLIRPLVEALRAATRYDSAIFRRGQGGDFSMSDDGHAVAEGDDLDALYDDWIRLTRAALSRVEGGGE